MTSEMNLRIRELDSIPDSFYAQVPSSPGHTLFHGQKWHRLLHDVYGWQVKALAVGDDDANPLAWLPFVTKRRLCGRKINISLPLSYKTGWVSPQGLRPDPRWLPASAPWIVNDELEGEGACHTRDDLVTRLRLDDVRDVEALFQRTHASQIRRRVRKALDSSCVACAAESPGAFLRYAGLMNQTRRRQGSPTYPARLFPALYEQFRKGGAMKLFVVTLSGQMVAGVVVFRYRDIALYAYGASTQDREVIRLGVNQLAMWSAIQWAFESGCKVFDFGTSPRHQESLWKYKERYGGITSEFTRTVVGMPPGKTGPSQDSPLVRLASAVLRRMPQQAFNALSPALLKTVA